MLSRKKQGFGGGSPKAPSPTSKPMPAMSNEARKAKLAIGGHKQSKEGTFSSVNRDAAAIGGSGVLDDFRQLAGVQVPESEFDRTLDDDAVLVQQGLGKMSPDQIAEMKQAEIGRAHV